MRKRIDDEFSCLLTGWRVAFSRASSTEREFLAPKAEEASSTEREFLAPKRGAPIHLFHLAKRSEASKEM